MSGILVVLQCGYSHNETVMRIKKRLYMLIFLASIFMLPAAPSSVSAQVTCTGSACSLLPFSTQQFDQMLWDFNYQYINVLMEDMGKAAILTNMSSAPVGSVNLSGITFGGGVAAGYVEEHKVAVLLNGMGSITDIPSAGANVIPRAYFGINLGKFVGRTYDPFKDSVDSKPSWISPGRFDVYLSLMNYKYEKNSEVQFNLMNNAPSLTESFKASSNYMGADLYYHLMEGKSFAGPLFGFLGLSVGVGMHDALQNIEYYKPDSKSVINLNGGTKLIWHASDLATLNVRVRSNTAEIKTGIRFLYFFSLTGAVGSANNYGGASLRYTRYGRLYLNNDLSAALGLTIPDAWLSLNIVSEKELPRRTNYKKVGLELNFAAFKIAFEGIQVGKDKGGSIGARFAF